MRLQWIGQSSQGRSLNAVDLRLVNGYAEVVSSRQGKTIVTAYGTPGLRRFATLPGAGGIRGLYTSSDGRCFAVQGAGMYEIATNGSASYLGSLLTNSGPVDLIDNGTHLPIVDGPYGYLFDLDTGVFAQITDPDFLGATRVAYVDGYFCFNRPDTGQWYISQLFSPDINALDFATAEGAPDPLLGLLAIDRQILLFGTTSIEFWFDVGTQFPFQRVQGGFIEYGAAGAFAFNKLGDVGYWLGGNEQGGLSAYQTAGYVAQPISTPEQSGFWEAYSTVEDCLVWGQRQAGHGFVWFTFPTAGHTWVYDIQTALWHERSYREPATGAEQRHRANASCYAFGQSLVGDYANGNVYALDMTTYDDDGQPQVMDMIMSPVTNSGSLKRIRHDSVQLDAESGVGLASGQGSNPQALLRWSDDGGQSWSNEHWKSLGAIGQTRYRTRWTRLGAARDRRYRIQIADPVKRAILGLVFEGTELAS